MKFEWDERKNIANYEKHGVRFEDACYVFSDKCALNKFDEEHSVHEDRWIMLGRSILSKKMLVIVHTYKRLRKMKLSGLYLPEKLVTKNVKHI